MASENRGTLGLDRGAQPAAEAAPTFRSPVPFVVGDELARSVPPDPWASVVRRSIEDYVAGRFTELTHSWDQALAWNVAASWPDGPLRGWHALIGYHEALAALTAGTFRQEVLSLATSGGPLVEAHLRTTGIRGDRRLEMPSLLMFELVALRVQTVTEIPGDRDAWERFWVD